MKKTNFKQYISYVKQQKNSSISDEILEKDYMISYFLSVCHKQKEQGNLLSLNNLIFKGGTLLSRNYLNYPRISEDLDFTINCSNKLREISSPTRREKEIKKHIISLIEDIKHISIHSDFHFQTKRTDKKFIRVRNSRAVYLLFLYYHSLISKERIPLKIEINFLEHRFFEYTKDRINTIIEPDLYLKSIGYDLKNISINTYALDEIILEKYRAVLTRNTLKKRDILDLYFIHNKCKNVFHIDGQQLLQKIKSSYMISPMAQDNFKKNIMKIKNNQFGSSDDRIKPLLLTPIDEDAFRSFQHDLFKTITRII